MQVKNRGRVAYDQSRTNFLLRLQQLWDLNSSIEIIRTPMIKVPIFLPLLHMATTFFVYNGLFLKPLGGPFLRKDEEKVVV